MRWMVLVLCIGVLGCAYPRRSTSLSPVPPTTNVQAPPDLLRLRFTSAVIPPRQRGDSSWDDDGTPPDVFVRVYRNDEQMYESPIAEDTLAPAWEDAVTENLRIGGTDRVRIELWDSESIRLSEPIGIWRGRGLPSTALPGADARVMLEGRAELQFRVVPPEAHRGTGILEYEVRSSALYVTEVVPLSPAGRAGITEGTQILAIDGETIDALGEASAAGKISMASSRSSSVTVLRPDGRREDVQMDTGYVWIVR
ncbi:MAG: PDZ domain-containing protein [Myxococcota bacterium]